MNALQTISKLNKVYDIDLYDVENTYEVTINFYREWRLDYSFTESPEGDCTETIRIYKNDKGQSFFSEEQYSENIGMIQPHKEGAKVVLSHICGLLVNSIKEMQNSQSKKFDYIYNRLNFRSLCEYLYGLQEQAINDGDNYNPYY